MKVLQVSEVFKSFGKKKILDGVSFRSQKGQILGIFGRNGSGKSTLLKCSLGVVKANSIKIEIDGRTYKPSEVIPTQKIGFLPQQPFLPKELKVRDVIPLFFPKGDEQDRIFYARGVAGFDHKKIGQLSAGQLKYLEVLLLGNLKHDFLFLDEPFSLVEPHYIEILTEFLNNLKENKGLVITDHYYKDVLAIATQKAIIKDGKMHEIFNENDLTAHGYLRDRKS